jgi:hypothetical protein
MSEIDFEAALEAGAKAHFAEMKKSHPQSFGKYGEWEDLTPMTRYLVKEEILPIVNAVLLSIKDG